MSTARTPAPPPATIPAATSTAIGPARLWRRARGFLIALTALLVAGITLAALHTGQQHGQLDPRSADPTGSRAVAELLKARGVTTRVVTTTAEAAEAAGPGTTLLVTAPDLLGEQRRSTLRTAMDLAGGRTVLLAPTGPALTGLTPGVRTKGTAHAKVLSPGCALPAATAAGRATTGDGPRYTTDLPDAVACYPSGGLPTLLRLPGAHGADTVVLGSGLFLQNDSLADEGNAALALQLLGSRPGLVWFIPSPADSADGRAEQDKSFFDLIPAGWGWALLQLTVAAALAALWRARRLGPLVTERLPVAIRASEATEGRARLYRKAGARDRAATVLREAARERLAALVGVPPVHAQDPAALLPAVSDRLTGPDRDLPGLLFGPAPSDDAALVALADHLDALEREVRTS
ncbi:DUF4350 domain-containing protein [Streptomyces sp. NBC_00536]|uniref:DUF4350 domain-containing protein n=1 Tax=Streptomyces sp. NBC_00536 TaxID=2975769 RepID=UPI002E8223ED|nr:DUF4350 domain-containing protein [Streptomyces sp. NBC_00536]WUC79361.1 DUF4350 domain-containing protein [Streptomyces sp. NBC_00536]